MSQPYLGTIMLAAFNFTPGGYLRCDGQILSIARFTALFSLIGTTYGGNGSTTFALPDFRGRTGVGLSSSGGGPTVLLGDQFGRESVALTTANIPSHSHSLNAVGGLASTAVPDSSATLARVSTDDGTPVDAYSASPPDTSLDAASISAQGGGNAINVRNPYLGLNFVIAVQGIYPARN